MRAGDDLQTVCRVIGHEVEVIARVPEVVAQTFAGQRERDEDEATVVLEPRKGPQSHLRREAALRRIRAGIRYADELAGVRERPRVVEALVGLGVPLGLAAEDRAAVRARVQVRADLPLRVACEDERPAAEGPDLEITGLRHLALVAQVEPQAIPEPPFAREDLVRAEDLAVHAEDPRVPVLEDVGTATAHEVHPRCRGGLRHRRRPP